MDPYDRRERVHEPLVIGLDIGTESSKAVLVTSKGEILRRAERPHGVSTPNPGWFEQDADDVWWADAVVLIRELLVDGSFTVDGICVSGLGPAVLPADEDGVALRPGILYGIDTRAVGVGTRIERELGGPEYILDRCGAQISSQSAGPKLAWLLENEPELWKKTQYFFMAHNYIVHRLTGEYVLDHQSASQTTPFYDRRSEDWISEWVHEIVPGLKMPRLAWPAEIAGHVTPEASRLTGLDIGTPVSVGTIDAWAEAESVGVREPGDLMLMYGSTMFFVGVTSTPVINPALWSTQGNFPGQHTMAAGMASSGSLTTWFCNLLGATDYETLTSEAELSPPGARGLLALPYFAGERTPFRDHHARGVIAGLSLAHSRGDVYRALLEATAFGVRHNVDAFVESGFTPQRVVAVGGGTKHDLWPQIVSSATGLTQELPAVRIGACYGDAKFAAISIGSAQRSDDWNEVETIIVADEDSAVRYAELFPLYLKLYEATKTIQHDLAKWN